MFFAGINCRPEIQDRLNFYLNKNTLLLRHFECNASSLADICRKVFQYVEKIK